MLKSAVLKIFLIFICLNYSLLEWTGVISIIEMNPPPLPKKKKKKIIRQFKFNFSFCIFLGGSFLKTNCKCWVNLFQNKPWFLRVCSTRLLKTLWEKEKLLITSNFSFSHSLFYPFGKLSAIFIKFEIVVCKHFQFGRV